MQHTRSPQDGSTRKPQGDGLGFCCWEMRVSILIKTIFAFMCSWPQAMTQGCSTRLIGADSMCSLLHSGMHIAWALGKSLTFLGLRSFDERLQDYVCIVSKVVF